MRRKHCGEVDFDNDINDHISQGDECQISFEDSNLLHWQRRDNGL